MAAPPGPLAGPLPPHPTVSPYPAFNPWYAGPGPGLPGQCGIRAALAAVGQDPMPLAQPCTSIVPGNMNAMRTGWGIPGGPFALPEWAQLPCADPGHAHTVCYHCNRMNENLPWYRLAATRIMHQPPPPANETNHWRGFMTRLCTNCERSEKYLIYSRTIGAAGFIIPPLPPNAVMQARMYNYPSNTCTCKNDLDRDHFCRAGRLNHWNLLRPRLVQRRNRNRRRLFEIAIHALPHNPVHLRTATPERREHRLSLHPGYCLRACRCGEEITTAVAEFWQCMACEGIIEVNNVNRFTHAFVMANQPVGRDLLNSASVGRPLRIMRPKSAILK